VTALVEAGCDTAATDRSNMTGLMLAAGSGSAATLRAVLDAGGSELEAKDEDGATAFLYACLKGDPESLAVLVEAGCVTSVKNIDGQTGMMIATRSGSEATVRFLKSVEAKRLMHEAEDLLPAKGFKTAMSKLEQALAVVSSRLSGSLSLSLKASRRGRHQTRS
jgi:ankyrin repeat protein